MRSFPAHSFGDGGDGLCCYTHVDGLCGLPEKHPVHLMSGESVTFQHDSGRPKPKGTNRSAAELIQAAVNPGHYTKFSNGAQPAFICEHLNWNPGQAVRYLSRGETKPEIGLSAEDAYMQNLKKALWHIKREIMLKGGEPDEVTVPDPRLGPIAPGTHRRVDFAVCACNTNYCFASVEDLGEHLAQYGLDLYNNPI